jgi:hypothetical protein
MEKNNTIQINSFQDLIDFIENRELSVPQIMTLLETTMGIYYDGSLDKEVLIEKMQVFWKETQGIKERPLFLDKYS